MKLHEKDRTDLAAILNAVIPDKEWYSLRRSQRKGDTTFLCVDETFVTKYTDEEILHSILNRITMRIQEFKMYRNITTGLMEKLYATTNTGDTDGEA